MDSWKTTKITYEMFSNGHTARIDSFGDHHNCYLNNEKIAEAFTIGDAKKYLEKALQGIASRHKNVVPVGNGSIQRTIERLRKERQGMA